MSYATETSIIIWRGIKMTINYKENYFDSKNSAGINHVEVITENKARLPFTETGYRSHFTDGEDVKKYETPTAFVKAWLEESAKSKEWKAYEKKKNQLTLF